MPSLEATAVRRAKALERLCEITGAKPFPAQPETSREGKLQWEALLFENLAESFAPIIQRLDKLENEQKKDPKQTGTGPSAA